MIQGTMGCTRFYQLYRYFKASNLLDEASLEMHAKDWWKKIDPLITNFRNRAMEAFTPERDIAINELLIEAKGRSQHTLQIPSKAAGKGYKVYALYSLGYLYNFVFINRTQKIAEIPIKKGVRYTSTIIQYLMRRLLNGNTRHVIYLDNFFTTVSLLNIFKILKIKATGTCKAKN